jgi:anti-anti-sigma factor
MAHQALKHISAVLDGSVAKVSFRMSGALEFDKLDAIEKELGELIARDGVEGVVINMANIEYFGSRFLGILTALAKKLRRTGRPFALCRMRPTPLKAYNLTRLDTVIPHYASEEEALEALRKKIGE